ncbi:hypothetical protein ACU62C_23705 [Klebsiella aerogenes]
MALITGVSELRKYEMSEFDSWSVNLLFVRKVAYAFGACARMELPVGSGSF